MRLSTSNFDMVSPMFNRATAWLVAIVVILSLGVEFGTRYGFHRISHIQQRIYAEKSAFLSLRPGAAGAPRTVALVGNSFLLFSVDIDLLNKIGSGGFQYSRLVIEQTQYLDWVFGLERLLSEGARPDALVLVLGANHWLADGVRGEYFAHELMQPLDAFNVAHELDLDRTTASNYFFASLSSWLGGRAEIRKFILSNVLPNLQNFAGKLNTGPPVYPA